ncbi:MAG: type II toxin-antitoxin system RelE/ParE family toxin [Candidatus Manganitrophaceae bacterium]
MIEQPPSLPLKPVIWVGSSLKDFRGFPDPVKDEIGYVAQQGGKHSDAKPLKGFGGAGVLEVVGNDRGDTFRTIYTVRLASAVYVLHAFQKKSKTGRKTPENEIELVKSRLIQAEQIAKERKP